MALENTGKFAEAAQAYLAAAQTAEAEYLKSDALLAAARSFRLAGDSSKAVETLEGILKQFPAESPGVVEARVRLAELTGGRT
jgi:TolA-binding protein